jgi:hypothetical protein
MFAEVNVHMMVCHIIHRQLNMLERYVSHGYFNMYFYVLNSFFFYFQSILLLFILALIVISKDPFYLQFETPLLFISAIISSISFVSVFDVVRRRNLNLNESHNCFYLI